MLPGKIKAVIPAAGKGTRMLPFTAAVPKEMANVGSKPAIQYVVEEIYAAGIREIAMIVNRNKSLIMRYFLEETPAPYRDHPAMADLEALKRAVKFTFLYQSRPLGAADAVFRARNFVGTDPFALVFPDNIVFSARPAIGQLLERYRKAASRGDSFPLESSEACPAIVALHRIGKKESTGFGNCGAVKLGPARRGIYPVLQLQRKKPGCFQLKPGLVPVRMFPRFILPATFFRYIAEEKKKNRGGELDDVPILRRYVREKALRGIIVQGKVYDVGNIRGYFACVAHLVRQQKKPGIRGGPY